MFVYPLLAGETTSPSALLLPCASSQHACLSKISLFFCIPLPRAGRASFLSCARQSLLPHSHSVFKEEITHPHKHSSSSSFLYLPSGGTRRPGPIWGLQSAPHCIGHLRWPVPIMVTDPMTLRCRDGTDER